MAKYVQTKTKVQIISWIGTCIVHERFSAQEIEDIKKQNPEIVVLTHPECPPEVIAASDFTGSTSGMNKYVKNNQPSKVMLVTECSMSDNVQVDNPNVQFIKPCNLCPHMKTITLPKVLDCLENEKNEILIPEVISRKARKAVERMVAIGRSH
jgi:quinolinate synthase